MARCKQTARMTTGGRSPLLTEKRKRERRQWKKDEEVRKAKTIAARYTAEAREGRAVRRAVEAEKREAEMAAKEAKKEKKTTK
ncbi:unnamed protein product [Caenorhabditis brenneri]